MPSTSPANLLRVLRGEERRGRARSLCPPTPPRGGRARADRDHRQQEQHGATRPGDAAEIPRRDGARGEGFDAGEEAPHAHVPDRQPARRGKDQVELTRAPQHRHADALRQSRNSRCSLSSISSFRLFGPDGADASTAQRVVATGFRTPARRTAASLGVDTDGTTLGAATMLGIDLAASPTKCRLTRLAMDRLEIVAAIKAASASAPARQASTSSTLIADFRGGSTTATSWSVRTGQIKGMPSWFSLATRSFTGLMFIASGSGSSASVNFVAASRCAARPSNSGAPGEPGLERRLHARRLRRNDPPRRRDGGTRGKRHVDLDRGASCASGRDGSLSARPRLGCLPLRRRRVPKRLHLFSFGRQKPAPALALSIDAIIPAAALGCCGGWFGDAIVLRAARSRRHGSRREQNDENSRHEQRDLPWH